MNAEGEYKNFRRIARANDDSIAKATKGRHPCQKGNGECCKEPNLLILRGDEEQILQAVRTNRITPDQLQQVIERAEQITSGGGHAYCPFFNIETRTCGINTDKPVICIFTGSAGVPSTQEAADELDAGAPGLPFSKLSTTMCQDCLTQLENTKGAGLNSTAIYDFNDFGFFASRQGMRSISTFVLDRIAPLVK